MRSQYTTVRIDILVRLVGELVSEGHIQHNYQHGYPGSCGQGANQREGHIAQLSR